MAATVNKQTESMSNFEQQLLSSNTEGKDIHSHSRSVAVLSSESDLEQRQPEEDSLESSDASGDELEHSKAAQSSSDEVNGYDSSETYRRPAPVVKAEIGDAGKLELDVTEDTPKYQYAKSSNKKFLRSNDMLYFKIKATNMDRYVRENNVAALETMAAASYMATLTYADSKLELVVIGAKATTQIVQSLLHLKTCHPGLMFYLTRKLNRECQNVRMTFAPEYARQMTCSDDQDVKGEWKERSVLVNKVPAQTPVDLFEVLIPSAKRVYRCQDKDSCFVVEFANPEKARLFMKSCTEIRLQQHPLSFCLASRSLDDDAVDAIKKEKPRKRKISTKSTDSSELEEACTSDKASAAQESPKRSPPRLPVAGLQDVKRPQSGPAAQLKVDCPEEGKAAPENNVKKRKFEWGSNRGSKGGNSSKPFKGHSWGRGGKGQGGGRGSPDSGYSPSSCPKECSHGGSGQEPLLQQQMALLQNMTVLTQAMMVQGLGLGGMQMGGGRLLPQGWGEEGDRISEEPGPEISAEAQLGWESRRSGRGSRWRSGQTRKFPGQEKLGGGVQRLELRCLVADRLTPVGREGVGAGSGVELMLLGLVTRSFFFWY